jgi:type VI protein secretion system component Hcp
MRFKAIGATLVLASGLLLAAQPASAAVYANLKLPGVTGTSTTAGHEGEIPLLSFSQGASAKKGTGSSCSELSVMKVIDQTSPLLFLYTMAGVDFPSATLTYSKDTLGGLVDYYVIKVNNASITSVQNSGSNEDPIESVSMKGTSLDITFTPPGGGSAVSKNVTCK